MKNLTILSLILLSTPVISEEKVTPKQSTKADYSEPYEKSRAENKATPKSLSKPFSNNKLKKVQFGYHTFTRKDGIKKQSAHGLSFGYYLNKDNILGYQYSKSRVDVDDLHYQTQSLFWRNHLGNTFTFRASLYVRQFEDRIAEGEIRQYGEKFDGSEDIRRYDSYKDLGASISFGNQWVLNNFMISLDWFNVTKEFHKLSGTYFDTKENEEILYTPSVEAGLAF